MSVAVSNLISNLSSAEGTLFGPVISGAAKVGPFAVGAWRKNGLSLKPEHGETGSMRVATNEQLYGILEAQFGRDHLRPFPEFDDVVYYLPTYATVDRVFRSRQSLTRGIHYWPEVFDCDDFVYCLKSIFSLHRFRTSDVSGTYAAMAAGMLWGGGPGRGHVMNIVVTADRGILIVDPTPQARSIYPAAEWTDGVRYIVI